MNKLVSRNLVLRFKLGRKIVFAQKGNLFIYSNGNEYWRGGSDWYYRPKGGTGMTKVDYKDERFYSSTPRGAIANTFEVAFNKVSPILNKRKNFDGVKLPKKILLRQESPIVLTKVSLPKETNSDINVKNRRNTEKSTFLNQQKDSNNSFKSAFDTARNSGELEFTWNGKKYNTMKKGETKEQWLFNLRPSSSPELPTSEQLIQLVSQNVPVVESVPQAGTNTILNLLSLMQLILPATGTYVLTPTYVTANRSQTRDWMRSNGINPYSVTGAMRAAARRIRAGQADDNDRLLVKGNEQLYNLLKGYYKQGGHLSSRNIIERFKNRFNKN